MTVRIINESGDSLITISSVLLRGNQAFCAVNPYGNAIVFFSYTSGGGGTSYYANWYLIGNPESEPCPYIVTILDSFEQYPVTSGSITFGSTTVSADTSGVATVSGLSSGANTLTAKSTRAQDISLSKTIDTTTTGETTIYQERAWSYQ